MSEVDNLALGYYTTPFPNIFGPPAIQSGIFFTWDGFKFEYQIVFGGARLGTPFSGFNCLYVNSELHENIIYVQNGRFQVYSGPTEPNKGAFLLWHNVPILS